MSTSSAEPVAQGREALLSGWGRTSPTLARVIEPRSAEAVASGLAGATARGALARGLGRSYGDAAQNAGGTVLGMTGLTEVRNVDLERAEVTFEAGVGLERLVEMLVPLGLFVPVSPGTWQVTVGGAIAADVHGKNHHRDGSFCDHVASFELLTPDGDRRRVSREEDSRLFDATAGGMGLTGIILSATLRMLRVGSAYMTVDRERTRDLDDVMARMVERDHQYRYSVAWIDCLARGRGLGRSVLVRGDHARADDPGLPGAHRARTVARGRHATAPRWAPSGLLRPAAIRVFNEAFYRAAPVREVGRIESIRSFFCPLDAVESWNRLYGRRGLVQYQFVVPADAGEAVRHALERLSGARCPSFLAVLKRFGRGRGALSFPIAGWTLTLDVPAATSGLGGVLDGLDQIVAEAGGRVYLAKDSRLSPDMLAAMYPGLAEWRSVREQVDPRGVMRSDLARRLEV